MMTNLKKVDNESEKGEKGGNEDDGKMLDYDSFDVDALEKVDCLNPCPAEQI